MKEEPHVIDEEVNVLRGRTNTDEFPLPVAEDWDATLARAEKVADIVDKHLDFEEGFQGMEMRPLRLCPEQRVNLMTDLSVVSQ